MNFIEKSKQMAYSIDIVHSKEQKELTQKYIVPIIDEIMDLIVLYRKEFDIKYLKLDSSSKDSTYGELNIKDYPIGHCSVIRDGVFQKLSKSVYYDSIENIDFENLEDYESYYKIVEGYLNIKLYPNHYIPQIADIFPMIALDEDGKCTLFMHQEIILYKDISQNFALAKKFRESNSFQNKVLPEPYINLLDSLKKHISFNEF